MLENPLFWAVTVPAIVLMGFAKGGFSGLGALSVPMMTLVLSPVQAAAITLPILISQDLVSLWLFRGTWNIRLTAIMLAGAIVGVWAGFALAAYVSGAAVEAALGVVSIGFGAQRLWLEYKGTANAPTRMPEWTGVFFGAFAGFTSQIAHAGGPPAQMFLMPRRLPRDVFIGTTTLFFAVVNWVKVPAYLALGQFTEENLRLSAALLPVAVISTFIGARLVRRVAAEGFYRVVYVLLIAVGLKLAWDGFTALAA